MLARFPAESYPHLGETLRVFSTSEYDYSAEFEYGLDLILDGLERMHVVGKSGLDGARVTS